MVSQHRSPDSVIGPQPTTGRTFWISAAVFAACLALYIAERYGFRIFDESLRSARTGEPVVPSPLEILTLLGVISAGVCAGLVALVSSIIWLVRQPRRASEAVGDGSACATANGAVQQSAP